MTKTRDELVELRARAIYNLFVFDEPTGVKPDWMERGNSLKQDEARRMARATMEADRAAGLALVEREATEEMAHAAFLAETPDLNYLPLVTAAIAEGDILGEK